MVGSIPHVGRSSTSHPRKPGSSWYLVSDMYCLSMPTSTWNDAGTTVVSSRGTVIWVITSVLIDLPTFFKRYLVVSFAISIQKNSPGRLPGSFNSQLCHSLSSRSYRVLPGPTGHGNVGCIGSIWHDKWDTLGRYMRKFLQRGPLLTHIFEYLQVSKAKMCSQLPSEKKHQLA